MVDWIAWIDLEPRGKGRPRATAFGGGGRARVHPHKKTHTWEKAAALLLSSKWRGKPLACPVEVRINAYHRRPRCRPHTVSAEDWKTGKAIWRPSVPDVDNVAKIVLDALTLAGVLEDDRIVVSLHATTLYAAKGDQPGVRVAVTGLGSNIKTLGRK